LKPKFHYNRQWTTHAAERHKKGVTDLLNCLEMGLSFMQIKALGKTLEIYWPGQEKMHLSDWVAG
jgi:hypothetical protein